MRLPFIEGGSLGSIQETALIPEGKLLLLQVNNFQPKAIVIPINLSGHCRVNSNWSLFMNSVLSPYFTGIVTLHSALDCAVNSSSFVGLAGVDTVLNSNRFCKGGTLSFLGSFDLFAVQVVSIIRILRILEWVKLEAVAGSFRRGRRVLFF